MKMDEYFAPQYNFLGLDDKYSNFDKAKFTVLPIPYDATTSYMPGTRFGPEAAIKASRNVELYDEELDMETYLKGVHTFPPMAVEASGPDAMMNNIEEVCTQIFKTNKIPIIIGGEHSITYPIVKACQKTKGDNFGVLHFDAHADFRDSYEGTIYNHACVIRRIADLKVPIYQVGIRNVSAEEVPELKKFKVKTSWMRDMVDVNPEKIVAEIIKKLPHNIYITIDLDVLDPSIMFATGTPEPGGMTWYQLLKILRPVIMSKNIYGMDFVELAPIPGIVAPDFLTAKLIYRCMGYICSSQEKKG